jgi:hypothetical protein
MMAVLGTLVQRDAFRTLLASEVHEVTIEPVPTAGTPSHAH